MSDLTPEQEWHEFALRLNEEDMIRHEHALWGDDYDPPLPPVPRTFKPITTQYIGAPTWAHEAELIGITDALIADRLACTRPAP